MVSSRGVEAAARDGDTLPAGEQADEGVLLGGYDFAAQAGQGLAADLLENVGIAPFAMHALRGGIRLRAAFHRHAGGAAPARFARSPMPKRAATSAVVKGPWVRA